MVLDTKDILDPTVAESVRKAESVGEDQYQKFVEERLIKCEKPVTDVISKNKLPLRLSELKNDCNLFSRLYISCPSRSGDLDMFFAHENQASPPSLSLGGKLRSGTKADLLNCLELEEHQSTSIPVVEAKFLDGAAIVQMLDPGTVKSFQEYADEVFIPYVSRPTREKRGKGIRRRVAPTTPLPKKWKNFLRVNENKTELFKFLSQQMLSLQIGEGKVIYTTDEVDVLSTETNADVTNLAPCLHEEADTRLLLHVADAVQKGYSKVYIRTVYSSTCVPCFHWVRYSVIIWGERQEDSLEYVAGFS